MVQKYSIAIAIIGVSCMKLFERNKMAALYYANTQEHKLHASSNAVLIGLPPALRFSPFMSVHDQVLLLGRNSLHHFSLMCTPGWYWVYCSLQYIKSSLSIAYASDTVNYCSLLPPFIRSMTSDYMLPAYARVVSCPG